MRLIQTQIDAYDEAACGGISRETSAPFTAADLDSLEPLLASLKKLAG